MESASSRVSSWQMVQSSRFEAQASAHATHQRISTSCGLPSLGERTPHPACQAAFFDDSKSPGRKPRYSRLPEDPIGGSRSIPGPWHSRSVTRDTFRSLAPALLPWRRERRRNFHGKGAGPSHQQLGQSTQFRTRKEPDCTGSGAALLGSNSSLHNAMPRSGELLGSRPSAMGCDCSASDLEPPHPTPRSGERLGSRPCALGNQGIWRTI